ncbi:hypothetical protein [Aulosira sp. FACHB-615]|uniref:hypothetical protein n=1 Tax=Aulosira sp. FACHB-615 TaxID=2692777 RepID=UPI0016883223|nr:hypothetical protein [Aulosira sp. FACHB-615]MBD2492389.1 hypothetical protein [Aulosira sp. FACHB-615]
MFQTITFQKVPRIWRIQGNVSGDLSTLNLEILWKIDWVDENGITINSEPGGETIFSPTPELLASFQNIADAIYAQINPPAPPPE